eukprot:4295070-Amphidinium_carterae.3
MNSSAPIFLLNNPVLDRAEHSLAAPSHQASELQCGSVPFKLMCDNTPVRTRMSGARMVEPTTNGDISKVLHQEITDF